MDDAIGKARGDGQKPAGFQRFDTEVARGHTSLQLMNGRTLTPALARRIEKGGDDSVLGRYEAILLPPRLAIVPIRSIDGIDA